MVLELGELLFEQVVKEVKAQLHCSDVLSQEVNEVSRVQQVDETLEAVELFEFEGEEDHGYDEGHPWEIVHVGPVLQVYF